MNFNLTVSGIIFFGETCKQFVNEICTRWFLWKEGLVLTNENNYQEILSLCTTMTVQLSGVVATVVHVCGWYNSKTLSPAPTLLS